MEDDEPFATISVERWPHVHVRVNRPPIVDTEIDDFYEQFTEMLRLALDGAEGIAPEKIFLMFNVDGITRCTLSQQLRAAKFIVDIRDLVVDAIDSTAIVATNTLARVVLQAIIMIQPLQSRHAIFEGEAEADNWLSDAAQHARM